MNSAFQPQIILLREGTDTSQGKSQIVSNINACMAVAETIRTTLGPRGMDKLVYDGQRVTISNDGATIMRLLDIVHPAAKTLVDISMAQDAEVGDGTTSVVLLAAEILKEVKDFVEDGLHPRVIIKGLREACSIALKKTEEIAVSYEDERFRMLLEKCAGTALNSKLIARQKGLFAPMVVDAVMHLDPGMCDIKLVGIKKITGGSVTDSHLVQGVAFKKTFSYAGFEQQPKTLTNPKILLLNVELELKSEKENAEVRITDPDQYQSIVDAEWSIIYEKLDKCLECGAKIILSRLPIGDLGTQYFADRGVFCAGRVANDDLDRVSKATGAAVQTSVFGITDDVLGECELFEERGVGDERYNFFTGCPKAKTATIILRGGGEQFLEETDRSVHDALMIVKRALASRKIVAGGGAIEMELSHILRMHARTIQGKQQLVITAFAKAFEVIPRYLAENSGIDSTDVLNRLRKEHATAKGTEGRWFGVDVLNEGICDTLESGVWEPAANKLNAIASATEAACCILSIDETVRNPQSEKAGASSQGVGLGAGGRGGGRGTKKMVSEAMGGRGMQGMMGKRGINSFRGKGGA
ncbi:chaperonin Cpn60/TCP-1 family [Ochromonadaceae sp. CCMP2298]|nr:chaperonin Cpn60/TCP-1 family [Ochromonadaceae sp. CCMP2298]